MSFPDHSNSHSVSTASNSVLQGPSFSSYSNMPDPSTTSNILPLTTSSQTLYSYPISSSHAPYQDPSSSQTSYQGPPTNQTPNQGPPTNQTPNQGPLTNQTPYQGPSTNQTPYQNPPTNQTPYQGPSTNQTPYQGPSSSQTSNQSPSTNHTSYQSPSTNQTPYQGPSSSQTSYQSPPTNQTPYQGPSSSQTSYQDPSTNQTPYQGPPTNQTPSQGPPTNQIPTLSSFDHTSITTSDDHDNYTIEQQSTPRRSPRKLTSLASPSSCDDMQKVKLLDAYDMVFVERNNLRKAMSAARKSTRPGYTLCHKLISSLFDVQELSLSRGQGLGKAKPGDVRPVLDKTKCSALKDYSVAWCKKNGHPVPLDATLNDAFTEKISYARKQLARKT